MKWQRDNCPVVRTSSLALIASSYTLRCDAKQAERCFDDFRRTMRKMELIRLGDLFPKPFIKGSQPKYLESLDPEGAPVVNTLSIQNLSINRDACRYISEEDFEALEPERKLRKGDVLLTMDGGTSIGKPVLFDLDEDFTVDSHVAILRPEGMDPLVLVYLLASPFGQLQFQQAESGASGQTAVTEEDVRRFVFPKVEVKSLTEFVATLDAERQSVGKQISGLREKESAAWSKFNSALIGEAMKKRGAKF
jgi:hypothetical protein